MRGGIASWFARTIVTLIMALLIAAVFIVIYEPDDIFAPGVVSVRALNSDTLTQDTVLNFHWATLSESQQNWRCAKWQQSTGYRNWYYNRFFADYNIDKQNFVQWHDDICASA